MPSPEHLAQSCECNIHQSKMLFVIRRCHVPYYPEMAESMTSLKSFQVYFLSVFVCMRLTSRGNMRCFNENGNAWPKISFIFLTRFLLSFLSLSHSVPFISELHLDKSLYASHTVHAVYIISLLCALCACTQLNVGEIEQYPQRGNESQTSMQMGHTTALTMKRTHNRQDRLNLLVCYHNYANCEANEKQTKSKHYLHSQTCVIALPIYRFSECSLFCFDLQVVRHHEVLISFSFGYLNA